MKLRQSFVTNSSSSSFLVIQKDNSFLLGDYYKNERFVIGEDGEREFGWERVRYTDPLSRINFTMLQLLYLQRSSERISQARGARWFGMLEKVIKEHTGAIEIAVVITTDWKNEELKTGYIDHQSAAGEGECLEMFDSEDRLKKFLFGTKSYIQGGNDNG